MSLETANENFEVDTGNSTIFKSKKKPHEILKLTQEWADLAMDILRKLEKNGEH